MASQNLPDAPDVQPVPYLLAGFGLIAVGFLWNGAAPATLPELRAATIAGGLLVVGYLLSWAVPRFLAREETHWAASGLWGLGAIACILASNSLSPDWDSLGLLYGMLGAASGVAAVLTIVPPWVRYALISLGLIWHFGGIFCAITVVPPPNGQPPFLATQVYVHWYHKYLIALNMNNGYHFYAPEPGPCALAWFRVEWEDGAHKWVRIPDHEQMRNHLERRRHGALATVLSQTEPLPNRPEGLADALIERRVNARPPHKQHLLDDPTEPPIPMAANMPFPAQYRQPSPSGRMLLASYARFVCRTTAHPDGGTAPVKLVKIYMVEYYNPPVEHFQAGREPLDPSLYHVFFMGDYDAKGTLLSKIQINLLPDSVRQLEDGKLEVTQDPFLYWRLPIAAATDVMWKLPPLDEPPPLPRPGTQEWEKLEGRFVNFARVHAGHDKDDVESIP